MWTTRLTLRFSGLNVNHADNTCMLPICRTKGKSNVIQHMSFLGKNIHWRASEFIPSYAEMSDYQQENVIVTTDGYEKPPALSLESNLFHVLKSFHIKCPRMATFLVVFRLCRRNAANPSHLCSFVRFSVIVQC